MVRTSKNGILQLIKSQNFDMDDLSKVLNVTKETLSKMLNGKVTITTSQLNKIADYLHLDLDTNALKALTSMDDTKDLLGNVTSLFQKK